ncbi:MAG: RNA polymerase sigma factor RpoD/SigA [Thermodesulfobacteriota bacterium]
MILNDDLIVEKTIEHLKEKDSDIEEEDVAEEFLSDTIRIYFKDIKKFPLLSGKEEKELALQVSKNVNKARDKMIQANLRLVVKIAKRYLNRGIPFQDLIEEGNIGLIKAVEKFKVSKGCKLSTYATYWIKQSIERAIANQANVVRLPIHVTNDIVNMLQCKRQLVKELNREPSVSEISHKLGVSGRYVKKLMLMTRKTVSLETSFREGSTQSLLDVLEDAKIQTPVKLVELYKRQGLIDKWLGFLTEVERKVILLRFGLHNNMPQTLGAIGKTLGVTRERIRQIEVKSLEKLKQTIKNENITPSELI